MITQFRNGGPRANTSMEASFTGILEKNDIPGWINQRGIYFHNLLGIKWHSRRAEMQFWVVNKNNKRSWRLGYHGLCPVAFLNGVYEPMDLDTNIGKDNEIFSSHWRLKAYISANQRTVQTDVAWTWSMEDDTSVLAGFLSQKQSEELSHPFHSDQCTLVAGLKSFFVAYMGVILSLN